MIKKIIYLSVAIGLIVLMGITYISFNSDNEPISVMPRQELKDFKGHFGYDKTAPRIIDTQEFKQAYYQ